MCLPLLLAMSEPLLLNAGYMLDTSHGWDRQVTSCLLSVRRSDYRGVRSTCLPLQCNPLLHGQISGSFMRKIKALMLQTTVRKKTEEKKEEEEEEEEAMSDSEDTARAREPRRPRLGLR